MKSSYRSPVKCCTYEKNKRGQIISSIFLPVFICALFFTSMSASAIDVRMKDYDGPYNFVETADSWFDPYLKVNGVTISPIVDNNTDLVVSMCDGPQAWQLLKEYTPWKDVNRFGFYTDLGVGSNQELIFEGIRNEGYVTTTSLTGGTIVGFWLHNDVNGDSVFNGDDSYLFSERSLTAGSGANEHQWFRVYDVSAYKGTGATYGFYCATESFTCTGDFDYLLYIDDDHTSSNFDHNDLILGITCEASLPDDCGNIQPGVPPNYFGVDTSYFLGVPALPLPPPDSGGVYIWLDTTTWLWTIASHIYSKGNSLEQFHGNVVALLDEPPQLGVNVFIDNFELWYDTVSNRCLQQNDRWGWSLWDSTLGLYEIWWDVTTKEYKFGAGDLNDFLTIRLTGTAIDFNIWSSGHEDPFNADEIYLGAGMITLADIPGFHDYGGFDVIDEYQAAVGSDPTSDPNTSVFSRHCGIGYSYNSLGLIDSSDSYVCDSDYGLNYAGPWVYQADGIQFSTSGIQNQCVNNNPPVCNLPDDATYFVCGDSTFSFPISADDPDENLIECRMVSGDGTFDSNTWSFTADGPGVYTASFECEDFCGAICSGTVNITVQYNSAPVIDCPANITIACDESADPANTGTATATDDHDPSPDITFTDNETAGSCSQEKTITRTWTATDDCGATAQCQQTITVIDNVAPVISCPANITIECDESTDPSNTGTATATDNCDTAPVITYADVVNSDTITRTWTATDACGNSATCQQVITIDDTTAPVITCPANI
nr:hypothetical protein [candidate division Zixibacteria bacterium]